MTVICMTNFLQGTPLLRSSGGSETVTKASIPCNGDSNGEHTVMHIGSLHDSSDREDISQS